MSALRIAALIAVLIAAAVALPPSIAHAGEIEEFETARTAYDAGDYQRAANYFEELVAGEVPRLTSPALIAEARKYLGASYLYLNRREAAREQFEILLRAQPDYQLDPLRFPAEIQEVFGAVRERLLYEREEASARSAIERRAAVAEGRARALLRLAEEEVAIEVENSRWIAMIPGGVGQFQNGQDTLGWTFLVAETVLFATAIGALIWHQDIEGQVRRAQSLGLSDKVIEGNRLLEAGFIVHWTALGAFAATLVAGIVEAQASFVATRTVTERRQVPDELRDADVEVLEETPAREARAVSDLALGVGPCGISFSFRW
jgi:hypothetical protein